MTRRYKRYFFNLLGNRPSTSHCDDVRDFGEGSVQSNIDQMWKHLPNRNVERSALSESKMRVLCERNAMHLYPSKGCYGARWRHRAPCRVTGHTVHPWHMADGGLAQLRCKRRREEDEEAEARCYQSKSYQGDSKSKEEEAQARCWPPLPPCSWHSWVLEEQSKRYSENPILRLRSL